MVSCSGFEKKRSKKTFNRKVNKKLNIISFSYFSTICFSLVNTKKEDFEIPI